MSFGDRGSGSRFLHRSSRRRCRRHDASACSLAVDADVEGRRLVEAVAPPKPPMPPLVQGAAGRRVPGPAAHPRAAAPSCAGGRPFALVPARPERVIGQRRRQGPPRGQRAAQVGRVEGGSRWVASSYLDAARAGCRVPESTSPISQMLEGSPRPPHAEVAAPPRPPLRRGRRSAEAADAPACSGCGGPANPRAGDASSSRRRVLEPAAAPGRRSLGPTPSSCRRRLRRRVAGRPDPAQERPRQARLPPPFHDSTSLVAA